MNHTYEQISISGPLGESIVIKLSDGAYIPTDESNSDYQRYLRWLNGEEENGTIS